MAPHPAALTAALALTLLAACGPTISYHRDSEIPIPSGATWAWGVPDRDGIPPREGAMVPPDSIAQALMSAIEEQLVGRGFRRADPDSAQFVVHFHVGQRLVTDSLRPHRDPEAAQVPDAWGRFGGPEHAGDALVAWQEGTLVVDVLPRGRAVVAWRGVIAGEVTPDAQRNASAAIRVGVRRLMRGFP